MRAADTNVVVRYLVADDEDQFKRVCSLFESHDVSIATSVLLETEWVLRKGYKLAKAEVVVALRGLASTESVYVQDPLLLTRALDLAEQGLDFADALHLAGSNGCADFVSFDRALARRSAGLGTVPVNEP